MENELAPGAAALLVRQTVEVQLRNAYPYLKTEALESLLNKTSTFIESAVSSQVPIMAASRARVNFFSLSAELRNRIYELALNINPNAPVQVRIQDGNWGILRNAKKFFTPKLLQISQQIRSEAAPIFFGNVVFCAVFSSYTDVSGQKSDAFLQQTDARDYIDLIGVKHAGMIRNFVIGLKGDSILRLTKADANHQPAIKTLENLKVMILKLLGLTKAGMKDGKVKAGVVIAIGEGSPLRDTWRVIVDCYEARNGKGWQYVFGPVPSD